MPYSFSTTGNHPVFSRYFSSLTDPRRTHKGHHLYPLEEILFLCISAVISGSDEWTTISMFGHAKLNWLRGYYPYKHGIPSHDVLGKVFSALDPIEFSKCFTEWVNSLSALTKGEVIAIDGKSICGSDDKDSGKSALHVVSAYATESRLCLGQQAVDAKSNEITAIPALLRLLDIKDCTVTIDAMGCQKSIAGIIKKEEAEYVLAVKDNQPELREQVEKVLILSGKATSNTEIDIGHGRIEQRKCLVTDELTFLDGKEEWPGLKSIAKITSERIDKRSGAKSVQTSYYISSLSADAAMIGKAVRSHWAVENNLHWELDIVFKEDGLLKKKGNSALNYNIIAKMALTMLDREKQLKRGKSAKRILAALDDNYRLKILTG